jgi:hypothetical protein
MHLLVVPLRAGGVGTAEDPDLERSQILLQGDPGLTLAQFEIAMRTGHDPVRNENLAVMPWPYYRHMTGRDLDAIYAYLMEKDKEVLFTFYDFPAQHWSHLRTTNPIQSTFSCNE